MKWMTSCGRQQAKQLGCLKADPSGRQGGRTAHDDLMASAPNSTLIACRGMTERKAPMRVLACVLLCSMIGGVSEVLFLAAKKSIKDIFARAAQSVPSAPAPTEERMSS